VNTGTLLTILGVVGGGTGITALLTVLPTVRRLKADTRKVEADTDGSEANAAGVLSTAALAQMNAALERAKAAEVRAEHAEQAVAAVRRDAEAGHADCQERLQAMETEMAKYRAVAQDHVMWDVQRVSDLTRLGVARGDIPDAPPLLPRSARRGRNNQ